jgi:flagellar basal body-associated protein FliL
MPEKADKQAADAPAAGAGGDKKDARGGAGVLNKTPVLLSGVMLLEAVVLFAGINFLGGGPSMASAEAAALAQAEAKAKSLPGAGAATDKKKTVEVAVVDLRATNKVSGRTILFDVSIYVVTSGENADKVKAMIGERGALIKDRVATIIRQSDPEKLGGGSEPGLETLRRQVKYQLDEIVGEGLVEEVLVPRCIPFRADL